MQVFVDMSAILYVAALWLAVVNMQIMRRRSDWLDNMQISAAAHLHVSDQVT